MREATPELQIGTLFVLDQRGRIVATNEPLPARSLGPLFMMIRGTSSCAWAVRGDISAHIAGELESLARGEPPTGDFRAEPVHAERYLALCRGRVQSGPASVFPSDIPKPDNLEIVTRASLLSRNFRGWLSNEIAERSPIFAAIESGYPVSICFCARKTAYAAEAGVETAEAFRGRGFAERVTRAWARSIRESGRIPLYSTSWSNSASLAVARKLSLVPFASNWSLEASESVTPPP